MSVLEKILSHVNSHNKIIEQEKMWKEKEKRERSSRSSRKGDHKRKKSKHCKCFLEIQIETFLLNGKCSNHFPYLRMLK